MTTTKQRAILYPAHNVYWNTNFKFKKNSLHVTIRLEPWSNPFEKQVFSSQTQAKTSPNLLCFDSQPIFRFSLLCDQLVVSDHTGGPDWFSVHTQIPCDLHFTSQTRPEPDQTSRALQPSVPTSADPFIFLCQAPWFLKAYIASEKRQHLSA